MPSSFISSRERYLTTFKHREPDRVPVFLDTGSPAYFTDEVRWSSQFEQAQVLLQQGCDPMINIWLPDPVVHPEVTIKTWREKTPEGKILLGKEFHTPKGVLRQIVEETADWCDYEHGFWVQRTLGTGMREDYGIHVFDDWNISRRTEPWVKGPDDLVKLPFILQKPAEWQLDEWRHDAQRAVEYARKHELLTMVRRTITSDATQWFCEIPWFMMQLYDDSGFVQEFLSIFEEVALWQTEVALELKPDVFQHRGWYDAPNFWGIEHFAEYVLPFIKRHVQMVHEADILHCYLLTQGWSSYLDLFQSLPTDILWGADPVQVGTTLETLKNELGSPKVILGGISSEQHLSGCSTEITRKGTREAIAALAPGGGFILASGSSIWSACTWANIAAMISEAHSSGSYPINVS